MADVNGWESAKSVMEEAARIVQSDRALTYDAPEDNFARIAACWTALLDTRLTAPLTGPDVARMMAALKLVRDAHAPKRDNRVDAIGYMLCLERAEPTET